MDATFAKKRQDILPLIQRNNEHNHQNLIKGKSSSADFEWSSIATFFTQYKKTTKFVNN